LCVSELTSQSSTFLRAYIHLGFNQDEKNRIVWDGSNPHIASRVIDMNRRFALPGGTISFYELGVEAPVWWEDWNDTPRGRGKSGLIERCRISNTCPKIVETFGSDEIGAARSSDGRDRRQGGHSAAGECSPVLLPGCDARRRCWRLQHHDRTGGGGGWL
jgi:hypothetical protein